MYRKMFYLMMLVSILGLADAYGEVSLQVDAGDCGPTQAGWISLGSCGTHTNVGGTGIDVVLETGNPSMCECRNPGGSGTLADVEATLLFANDENYSPGSDFILTLRNLTSGSDYTVYSYHSRSDEGDTTIPNVTVTGATNVTKPSSILQNSAIMDNPAEISFTAGAGDVVIRYQGPDGGCSGCQAFFNGFELYGGAPAGPAVQFASGSSGDVEAVTPALVEVILTDAQAGETYYVDYAVIGGTAIGGGVDYTLAAGTLTFLPDSVSELISIDIIDDGQPEDDETIVIELSNPVGLDLQLGDPTQHTYTILDPRPTAEFDEAGGSGMEDVTPVNVSVSLSAAATETITVDYDVIGGTATGGGVDYTLDPGTLTFNIDDVTKNIVIDIISDANEQEPAETIIIGLSNPVGAKLGSQTQYTYTIVSEMIHLKVDFALVYCPDTSTIRPESAKPGWWHWAAEGWADMYMHDMRWEDGSISPKPTGPGIDGTGIHACITTGSEGQLGLHMKDLCRDNLGGGGCPYDSPAGDPICNTFLYAVDWAGPSAGDILLLLTDMPPGEYWLYSYHNHWEPCTQGTRNCLRCECDMPAMPTITANPAPSSPPPEYNGYSLPLGTGTGVTQIENAYNVWPTHHFSDDDLVPSLIKFETDGSMVLVIYEADNTLWPDCARDGREGTRGILNAFELIWMGPGGPDTSPPTPNPATFASAPAAVSDTEITMTATTGSDPSGPVEYYFDETSGNPGGTDSGWVTNPVYNDTGLTASTQYTYTVQMRDSVPNTGTASAPANATTDPTPDTDPPTPNPATFASPPAAVSHNEITMTATTGSDASPPVEYYFDETSGNPGGSDSGWVTNPVYSDTGLTASTQYTYTVQMRDSVPNTGTASAPANATTDPAPPDTDPPTPDPATFSSPPAAVSSSEITMTATTGSDASPPVEYYFDESSGNPGGSDSGWVTNPVYNDTGLDPSTQYTYTVQMRDSLLNTGTASAPANATTPPSGPAPTVEFDLASSSGNESVTPVNLAVSLSAPATETITVDFAVVGGNATDPDDYTIAASPLTFNVSDVTKNIVLDIVSDGNDAEGREYIYVQLQNPVNANLGSIIEHKYQINGNGLLWEDTMWYFDNLGIDRFFINGDGDLEWDPAGGDYMMTRIPDEDISQDGQIVQRVWYWLSDGDHDCADCFDCGLYCHDYDITCIAGTSDIRFGFFQSDGVNFPTQDDYGHDTCGYRGFAWRFGPNMIAGPTRWVDCQSEVHKTGMFAYIPTGQCDLLGTNSNLGPGLPGFETPPGEWTVATFKIQRTGSSIRLEMTLNDRTYDWTTGDLGTSFIDVISMGMRNGRDYNRIVLGSTTGPDNDPPDPDPMTWATTPYGNSSTTVTMVATTASDVSGVEYYFECTAGGGNDSGWQDSTIYEDSGLQPDTTYTYRVKASDKSSNQNETAWSTEESGTTLTSDPLQIAPSSIISTTVSSVNYQLEGYYTINENGLTGDLHTNLIGSNPAVPPPPGDGTMWLANGTTGAWIEYEFDQTYTLTNMWVWNYNQDVTGGGDLRTNRGINQCTIEYSINGTSWTQLGGTQTFAEADGSPTYAHNTEINFGNVDAKYVRITSINNHGGNTTGLSEIRFYHTGADDTDPPTPDPATFAVAPAADSDTAISMTATTGSDASPPVEYFFDETSGNPGGTDSGWQTSTTYTDTGLTASTQYTYTVQMRDSLANTGTASAPANATTDPTPDTDPPTPDPATFAVAPAADSDTAISMTATTGSDDSPPVEYFFDETSGNPGGTDSGWQTSTSYTDSGLDPNTQYTYTVQMRDSLANTGTASAPANATTDPAPDTDPPTPNPATFASPPAAVSDTQISMTATTGSDDSPPVEYYFDETSGNPGGSDSGWVTNPVYIDTGLQGSTQYTYTVQMRDSLANTGTASAPANATTDPTPDTDPPTPNPATFASAPAAVSDTEITMTATTGSDASPPVEYYFDETSGNPGGTDSGWVTNPVYNDTGLQASTQYTYTVQMRDSLANTGTASAPANATTNPAPDTDPPTPNPATFASAPAAVSDTEITMTATTGSDASPPVQYFFDETSGNPGGTDSGWVTNPVYNDTGLQAETQYTYTVQMRDNLANTGTASAPANATTDPTPDTDPPTPDPATFVSPPAAVSDTEITMTATTGSDPSGPVEYYFDETSGNPGGTDSGWVTNPVYNDTGLQGSTQYTYTVQMRDSVPNTGTASAPANATTDPTPDNDPPTPDPATFASAPAAVSDTEITMTATTGSDASPPVEYYFDETSGNPGGTDSGWVTNPVYNDTGLQASTQYTYTVQMRDSVPNTGTASAPANATTDPPPDTDPPTPDPATFASAPSAVNDDQITMTATTGSDASGPVEYFFDETSGNPGGSDSGWQTSTSYTDSGLDPETQYTYTVQMRDSLLNTGTASAPASATTDPKSGCGAAPMYRDSAIANVSAAGSCSNALLPLIPSILCLGFWSIRRRNRR